MKNSRKSERIDAQLFISYDVIDKKGKTVLSGMGLSKDLSRKGLKMEDRYEFTEGSKIKLHLAVGDEVVDVNGIIRRVEKGDEEVYYIGIEFKDLDPGMLEKIGQFYPDILKN